MSSPRELLRRGARDGRRVVDRLPVWRAICSTTRRAATPRTPGSRQWQRRAQQPCSSPSAGPRSSPLGSATSPYPRAELERPGSRCCSTSSTTCCPARRSSRPTTTRATSSARRSRSRSGSSPGRTNVARPAGRHPARGGDAAGAGVQPAPVAGDRPTSSCTTASQPRRRARRRRATGGRARAADAVGLDHRRPPAAARSCSGRAAGARLPAVPPAAGTRAGARRRPCRAHSSPPTGARERARSASRSTRHRLAAPPCSTSGPASTCVAGAEPGRHTCRSARTRPTPGATRWSSYAWPGEPMAVAADPRPRDRAAARPGPGRAVLGLLDPGRGAACSTTTPTRSGST